jgi:prepilin-type N-terminal cleavage/methylation domain-containing protein
MMNKHGFALTELVAVLGLIAILLTIATLNFNSWTRKYGIESQLKELHADMTSIRLRAIQTKQPHLVRLNPQGFAVFTLDDAGAETNLPGLGKALRYRVQLFDTGVLSALNDTDIVFNERGYVNLAAPWDADGDGVLDPDMALAVGIGEGDAALNCLAIQATMVKMGRINATTNRCDLQ